jgi:threonine/homoserine/homoserine lactone efflux protein
MASIVAVTGVDFIAMILAKASLSDSFAKIITEKGPAAGASSRGAATVTGLGADIGALDVGDAAKLPAMPSTTTLLAFTAAAAALILLPGPNVIYLLARGISDGRRIAMISVFGVEAATAVFVLATAVGLSAVIASSAVAFSMLRYAGASYLVFLGVRTLRGHGGIELATPGPRRTNAGRAFVEAFGVGIANPKVAIFFVAFFPQFLDPHRGSTTTQILVLGTMFTLLALGLDSAWAAGAGTLGGWLRRRPGWVRRQRAVAGSVYLALGATAALTGASRTST